MRSYNGVDSYIIEILANYRWDNDYIRAYNILHSFIL